MVATPGFSSRTTVDRSIENDIHRKLCTGDTETEADKFCPDLEEPGFARIRERDALCITLSFVAVLSDQHTRLGVVDLRGPVARYLPPNLTFVNFANKGKTRRKTHHSAEKLCATHLGIGG